MNMLHVIQAGAYQGMSDDQLGSEYRAMKALAEAVAAMTSAIAQVNHASAVVTISSDAWADFIHDEIPTDQHWDEMISEARR